MKEKILIIEDDKYLTDDIEIILDLFDYETSVVNYVDDIKKIDSFHEFKVILLDIMMRTNGAIDMNNHKESGEVVYQLIRNESEETPVIVMSAMDKEDININFSDINTKYIKKPFSGIEQLMELIN